MPVVKLTPNMLKRMVLEEKKKIENSNLDKAKLKAMELEMDEGDWGSAPPHAVKRTHATANKVKQDGNGAGDAGYKKMKDLMSEESELIARLEQIKEHKANLRRRILASR